MDPYVGMNPSLTLKEFNPNQNGFAYGDTRSRNWDFPSNVVTISLAFELLEPLMGAACTSGERATNMFRIAATLLHEIAVGYY